MAKKRTKYVCNSCGASSPRYLGKCPHCEAWESYVEEIIAAPEPTKARGARSSATRAEITTLDAVDLEHAARISSGIGEFDRVLGGGIMPGSIVLVGGDPGVGKSTLMAQMCAGLDRMPVLYITGEESLEQVAMRARRLGLATDRLRLMAETNVEAIIAAAENHRPRVLVVDSIQVVHSDDSSSAPGSVSQVRECAAFLTRFAKRTGTVLFLVGHVTKDGSLAGPKVLEHMIDCSILLEGGHDSRFRTLRGQKNRFGAVNELGVFAMTEQGLREVRNPSAIFLDRSSEPASGSAVMVVWEGTRPLLVEIQALVDDSALGNPRRVAVGLEQNRLAMLLAVLHRHGGLQVGDQDVFANVVGGVKVLETSADLALLLAIVSSFRDRQLPRDMVIFGEVGLSGEIRPVPSGQERLSEAAKHGFRRAIVPKANAPRGDIRGMQVIAVSRLEEALAAVE